MYIIVDWVKVTWSNKKINQSPEILYLFLYIYIIKCFYRKYIFLQSFSQTVLNWCHQFMYLVSLIFRSNGFSMLNICFYRITINWIPSSKGWATGNFLTINIGRVKTVTFTKYSFLFQHNQNFFLVEWVYNLTAFLLVMKQWGRHLKSN